MAIINMVGAQAKPSIDMNLIHSVEALQFNIIIRSNLRPECVKVKLQFKLPKFLLTTDSIRLFLQVYGQV
jgi:hypothetical protein